ALARNLISSRRRHGGAVRHEPAHFRPRRGGARGSACALPRPAGRAGGTQRALARGRVHRADGTGAGQFPMSMLAAAGGGFWGRVGAMLRKELLQLRRDRVTLATMISIPLLQLIMFGYAINTTPRDLPTAVLLQESSDVGRSILAALQNTKFFA